MTQLSDYEYGGTALIADPIHRYIQFTVPQHKGEVTEKALIDSPWVQRLRYIYQLQSARWVIRQPSTAAFSTRSEPCTWRENSPNIFIRHCAKFWPTSALR